MATKTRRLADLLANIDDNSKVTSAGLLDATITAADLANDSVGTAEIIDDAVTAAAIADDAVGADALASNAVVSASIVDANITAAKLSSTALASVEHVKPHIQPGILYPAWEGYLTENSAVKFVDSSTNAATISARGNDVHHSPHEKKNGSTSIKFNGIDDIITVPNNADFDWGTGDFTLEMWFQPWGALGSAEVLISTNNSGGTDSEFYLRSENGRLNWARGADNLSGSTSDFNSLNTWYHVAFVNASGTITCYKNGTALYNFSAGGHDYNPNDIVVIGARQTGGSISQHGQYYMDNIRITKGLAVYTGNFTAPTGALTTTWAANPFGGSNTAANADASKVGLLLQSAPTGRHSGEYGSVQTDGKKYFYTDISGSKPIKDPRIGTHFGSQRHKIRSTQFQSGHRYNHKAGKSDVYTADGREWCRVVGSFNHNHDSNGFDIELTGGDESFMEITGYFSDANIQAFQYTNLRHFTWRVDGGSRTTNTKFRTATNIGALGGRHKDSGGWQNIGLGATLGIHTLKIQNTNIGYDHQDFRMYGFELVAHGKFTDATCDTNHTSGLGSPASTSKITMDSTAKVIAGMSVTGTGIAAGTTVVSVDSATVLTLSAATTATNANQTLKFAVADIITPAQDVVSYGKKFSISAAATHYNPFATKGNGAIATIPNNTTGESVSTGWAGSTVNHWESTLDTATSLGLDAWVESGVYYRPVNGGRIVKWVDSTGTIKTSVNMMPPSAKAMGTSSPQPVPHSGDPTPTGATNWSTQNVPLISEGSIDHSQSELAKMWNWREFGNGNANEGYNTSGTKQDFSMLRSGDAVSYTMDDGLTSLTGQSVESVQATQRFGFTGGTNHNLTFTFIGTGFSFHNLREITHSGNDDFHWFIDGVQVADFDGGGTTPENVTVVQNLPYGSHVLHLKCVANPSHYNQQFKDIGIHQPKMPPIPENAVVLADYMLMADFVFGPSAMFSISKGIRFNQVSQDIFHDETDGDGWSFNTSPDNTVGGYRLYLSGTADSNTTMKLRLPSFGTNIAHRGYDSRNRAQIYIDDTAQTVTSTTGTTYGEGQYITTSPELGTYFWGTNAKTGTNGITNQYEIVTPTHTSSHYQPFDTPYQSMLMGGDRNMEQTNLVVTADGKTWDQVTRDTSYLGNMCLQTTTNTSVTGNTFIIFDEWNAKNGNRNNFCKNDFTIAYEGVYCLKDGEYEITAITIAYQSGVGTNHANIYINGAIVLSGHTAGSSHSSQTSCLTAYLKRGDYVQVSGRWYGGFDYSNFYIKRLG